jgi:LuxR family maltose regulon positive regulatory protein
MIEVMTIPHERLLTAKLRVPAADSLVPRPRLIERIATGLRRPLTVVAAPAGSGKTSLLAAWARATDRAVAWFALDTDDNDPVRFLTYLTAAFGHAEPGLGDGTRRLLDAAYPPGPTAAMHVLADEVEAADRDVVLVLDDYHAIDEPAVHEAIAFLIDHLPPRLRVVIAGRDEPPLPLARLRARNQLTELRGADLRFTPDEAAALLADLAGDALAVPDITTLTERTEGWAAGLVLAGLSLQGRTDPAAVVANLSGSHRFVLDYLIGEVLCACIDPAVERFLVHTSILDRLTAPLCEALTGDDAAPMLERIERANLFLIPLDDERRWYRYHHLFAEALRHHLQQHAPALVPELHRRAAEWFEREGFDADALRHVLAIPDADRAANIVERQATALLTRGEVRTLRAWVEALPKEVMRTRPIICLRYAWALAHANALDAVEPCLRDVEAWLAAHPATPGTEAARWPAEIAAIRARVAVIRGDSPATIEYSKRALALAAPDDYVTRSGTGLNLGSAYGAIGDLTAAKQAYAEVVAHGPAAGPLSAALALRYQADLEVVQGHLHAADRLYQDALAFVAAQNADDMPAKGIVCEGLAVLAYFWNNLDDAERLARDAIARGERGGEVLKIAVPALLTLARVLQARGDHRGARDAIDRADCLSNWPHIRAWQARLWLQQGNLPAAQRWTRESGFVPSDELTVPREVEYSTLARVLLAEGRHDEALDLLSRLIAAAERWGRDGWQIDFLTLHAVALQTTGEPDEAAAALTRALRLAVDEGHVRVFVDEGAVIGPVLSRIRGQTRRAADPETRRLGAYADHLLTVLAAEGGESPAPGNGATVLIEPLSDREREVLRHVAAGRSNREIADALYVSLGTVKAHTHHVFAKLGVRGRTEAIARGRDLGLLD